MTGRAEVSRLRQHLDAVFARAKAVSFNDTELRADLARHLCVLVAGFVERAVAELAMEMVRQRSDPSLHDYAWGQLRRLQNLNTGKLLDFLGSINGEWRALAEVELVDAKKDALDSVYRLRNRIAHGEAETVSLGVIEQYYLEVIMLLDYVANLLLPVSA